MEYLDILDKNGRLTGQKKLREEVHRDGDWHRSAHIWIINSKREILIQKRAAGKDSFANMWDISSAGHISAGEEVVGSAVRELAEELGATVKEEDFKYLGQIKNQTVTNNGAFINNQFNEVFLVELDLDISKLKLQEEEVAEVKFVPFEELEKIVNGGALDFVPHPEEYNLLFSTLRGRQKQNGFTPYNPARQISYVRGNSRCKHNSDKEKSCHSGRRYTGFTLVELIVGLGIIAAALFSYFAVLKTVTLTRFAKHQALAYQVAVKKIEELKTLPFASLPAGGAFSESALLALPQAQANLTVADYGGSTSIKEITVTVGWQESVGGKSVELKTLLTGGGI